MATLPPRAAPAAFARWRRWAPTLAATLALALLLKTVALMISSAGVIVRFPYGIDYGEGIVWQQLRNIMAGTGYGPLGVYPAIVYHYPPVFHVVVGVSSRAFGADELATGRLVSFLAALGTAAIIGLLAAALARPSGRATRLAAGLFAALMFLCTEQVAEWAPLMRVDLLACLFSVGGLALAASAVERPRLLLPAAISLTLAVYTKQVSLAAPVAAFAGLLAVRPRAAWQLAAYGLTLGLVLLTVLTELTHGGFLRHIVSYNVNRFRPDLIGALIYPLRVHLTYIALAGAGTWLLVGRLRTLWPQRINHASEVGRIVAALVYLVLKCAMLALIMKSGANLNYLIEWFGAVAIVAGAALAPLLAVALRPLRVLALRTDQGPVLLATAVLLALALQVARLPYHGVTQPRADAEAALLAPVAALISATPKPVISDDMALLIRAGRPVEWEPAIVAELGAGGRYDERAFARMVRAHRFGLFITEGDRGEPAFDSRYNPIVADAIAQAYPRKWVFPRVGFTVHAPR